MRSTGTAPHSDAHPDPATFHAASLVLDCASYFLKADQSADKK